MDFQINVMPEPVAAKHLARLAQLETVLLGHFLQRGILSPGIGPVLAELRACGTAVTLSLPAQDSTMLHHAAGLLRSGDVLIIDRRGDDTHACLGGGVALALANSKAAGVVIDGRHTDTRELVEIGMPVWSRGSSALTTRIQGIGGAMNVPVSCGGVPVIAGDAVLADEHGVVVIPRGELGAVLARAEALKEVTDRTIAGVEAGERIGALSGATAIVAAKLC
ncbi:MAG: dimethylmenaquinone methyltransferase [Rhizobiales bacterium]|nr:dimethylmenaquinone methyltransferase [Hyphomicrobiales bacterium]